MNYPKVSIVTPSYNQGRYIEQTINSVLDQQYPNLEYFIIDGGSTDDTVEIIRKYEKHLAGWISEPDKGQTDAINKGFAKCTGEIFNWINSDDYYEPGTFKKLAEYFSEPSVNVVCGREWGFQDADPSNKILHNGSVIGKNIFETIRIGIIDQPCTFFRRSCIADVFPLDISLRYIMDRQLWWSYLLQYGQKNILQVKDIFTWFRLHEVSKSVQDGALFEKEFDRLKLSLFRQLDTPVLLEEQLSAGITPAEVKWNIKTEPKQNITAAFASYFAERHYINDELSEVSRLMKFVRSNKRGRLTKTEMKLSLAGIMPESAVRLLKKIKN